MEKALWRACALGILLAYPFAVPAATRSASSGVAPGSPLAADDSGVFAVGADRRTILFRVADFSKPWSPLTVGRPIGRIEGLARRGGDLYVVDSERRAVLRVETSTGRVEVVHEGPPLEHPTDIVVANDVYVADGSRVWRLSQSDEPRLVPLRANRTREGTIFLASTENSLLVSYPDEARIDEYRVSSRPGGATKWSTVQRKIDSPLERSDQIDTIQQRAFPEIKRPTRLAFFQGIVYVVDEDGNPALYAFGRHDQRPVRLVRNGTEEGLVSSVAVTREAMFVVHGSDVYRWRRLVPAEIVLPQSNLSKIMAAIYRYLLDNRILPARPVKLEQNIERTLKANRVLLGAFVPAITPVLCELNPRLCSKGDLRLVQQGETVLIPDVNSESFVDVSTPTPVDPGKTLGQMVDQLVTSEEFSSYRTEGRLRELNEKEAYLSKTPLRDRTDGTFVLPVEYIRYVTPIVATDAPPRASPLLRVMKEYSGVRIRSQEERLSMAYGSDPGQPQAAPDFEALKTEWGRLLKTIDYADPTLPLLTAKVGIAEEFVDEQHPDFVDRGASAWIAEDATLSAEPAAGTAATQDYRIRAFDRTDHGTMIGGVIGARHMQFENKGGLAPRTLLFHLHSSDPQIGEDIRRTFLRGVHLFNISAHFGKDKIPSSLEERIRLHPTALFVVAAGNDVIPGRDLEICNGLLAYPVCWADKKNVLVVTATNEAGDTVLAPIADQDPVIPGANWSPTAVHVAAPGVGFHAPGMNRSYVPARGSSFATPLVTAVAALLYGERVFDPWAIKQRIIATADPIPGLGGKVFAGRINVRRAIEDISDAVFIRKPRNGGAGENLHADVDTASRITVRLDDGSDRVIRLADVRRVQRQANRFRIIYVDRDAIRVDMVTFPTDQSSRISANAKDTGASIRINLAEWDDFVAPVPIM